MTTPDTTPPDAPMQDLDADLQNLSTHEYPKPPYANHDQAMLPDPCALQPATVRRAMEREGQMFKKMTHWIAGLKYLYWHEDTRTTELWYKSARGPKAGNDVHAFQRAVQCLEERLVFCILRPSTSRPRSLVATEWPAPGDNAPTDASEAVAVTDTAMDADETAGNGTTSTDEPPADPGAPERAWALTRLDTFKTSTAHRTLFEIPDWTTYGYPAWTLTPTMTEQMDNDKLYAAHLPKGESVIYDRRHFSFAWVRRDGAAYEIRAHNAATVVFAQRLILKLLVQVVSALMDAGQYQTLPPNAAVWVETYFWIQQQVQYAAMAQRRGPRGGRGRGRGRGGGRGGGKADPLFQARKGKKRQRLRGEGVQVG